jgi:hypothetical protein
VAIGELYSGTYCVYLNVRVSEFMEFWLENDISKQPSKGYRTPKTDKEYPLSCEEYRHTKNTDNGTD